MKKTAFTLTELMIVLVVIAIMAAWGVPEYGRVVSRARARNAINNLTMIHSANLMYQARNGGLNCPCVDLPAINNINGTNSLNIVGGGVTYACAGNSCTGTIAGSFTVAVDLTLPITEGANPRCTDTVAAVRVCP